MSKTWFDTGYFNSTPSTVDRRRGIISGVKICSVGEAKGHGVSLDAEFISTLVEQGNELSQGLKARFGHPNMCSSALGTFIGRFKNFREGLTTRDDGETVPCCFADLFLSNSAKDTPNGDLYAYVLSMAESESDMFGTSIVFTPGSEYRKDHEGARVDYEDDAFYECAPITFVECEKLHACDCVDEPAANDGLFSAFASETPAGLITAFLDQNPEVFEVLNESPDVLQAIAQHGDKMDEFLTRYEAYRNEQETPMDNEKDTSAEVAETEAEELETSEEVAEETEATETEEYEASKDAEADEAEEAEPTPEEAAEESELSEAEPSENGMPKAEFKQACTDFGVDIATEVDEAGGTYFDAMKKAFVHLKDELSELKKSHKDDVGGKAADFSEVESPRKKSMFKIK